MFALCQYNRNAWTSFNWGHNSHTHTNILCFSIYYKCMYIYQLDLMIALLLHNHNNYDLYGGNEPPLPWPLSVTMFPHNAFCYDISTKSWWLLTSDVPRNFEKRHSLHLLAPRTHHLPKWLTQRGRSLHLVQRIAMDLMVSITSPSTGLHGKGSFPVIKWAMLKMTSVLRKALTTEEYSKWKYHLSL